MFWNKKVAAMMWQKYTKIEIDDWDVIPFKKAEEAVNEVMSKGEEVTFLSDWRPYGYKPLFPQPPKPKKTYPPRPIFDEYLTEIEKFCNRDPKFPSSAGHKGLLEFREVIAEKFDKENDMDVDPTSEIISTVGSMMGMYLAFLVSLDPGDEVIMTKPGYKHWGPARIAGAVPVFLEISDEDEWHPNLEKLETLISPRTKMILINSPQNPTGCVYSKDDLEGIADISKRHDLIVVSDEAFEKVIFDGLKHISIASLPGMKERTITLGSTTKGFNVGYQFRAGYLVADKVLIDHLRVLSRWIIICGSVFDQKLATLLLRSNLDNNWVIEVVKKMERERDIFLKYFDDVPGITYVKPYSVGNMFPNIKRFAMSSEDFAAYLVREAKIFVDPGTICNGEGYIRFSPTISKETEEIIKRFKSATEKLLTKNK